MCLVPSTLLVMVVHAIWLYVHLYIFYVFLSSIFRVCQDRSRF